MQRSPGGDFSPCPRSFPACLSPLRCLYKLTQELHDKHYLEHGILPKLPAFPAHGVLR